MKLLVLVSRVPYPLDKGDKLRVYHQVRELSKRHEVHLCCLDDNNTEAVYIKHLKEICNEVSVFRLNKVKIYWNLFRSLFSRKPYQVNYFYQLSVHRKIKAVIHSFQPDRIYCQLIRTTEYVKNEHHIVKTLDYMDAFSKGIDRRVPSAGILKPVFKDEAKRLLKYEHLIFDYFDQHAIISEEERLLIYHQKREEITIVTNGIDTSFFTPQRKEKEFDLIFVGNMSYAPNVAAVTFLAEEVMPHLTNVNLLIAGASPSKEVLKLASSNISVTGWVEDIREAYANAKIFVAPLFIGTGLQNKLLEAMAMELPCITTELVNNSLKAKVKSHNEKSDRKVTLGMLKAVYRRGAGAYSTSHRPGVSRAAWSMARVNAFLTLVRRGRPANSKYVQDNDLLPSNHPKKSRKADIDITEEDENISMASEDCGCGCGGCGETVEAASHQYDNPADAMEQAKKMGCDEIHTHDVNGETMFMPCKDMREYQEKSGGKMEVEGYKDEDEEMEAGYHKKKMASESCPVGEEMVEGVCKPIAVTMEITIDDVLAKVEASTGKNIIEISGIAFHEGKNKNNWSLTRKGAELAVSQMVGADLTLNHPKPSNIGFSRNMDGGIDEAVVGVITEASIHDLEDGKWNVRYKAEVHRVELFEALDSGLWLRAGYGVSIGGYGVPIQANDDGIVFENDFTFDHLAIVHRPAYPRANIELAEKKQKAMASETFKYQGDSETDYQKGEIPMDDEMINEEMGAVASEALAEAEKLKADLILAQATIAEYKAIEAKKVEDERLGLVAKATEMGLKGHEDLSSETITQLIASWESAKPTIEEVEMKPATPAVASEQVKPVSQSVVANYLNGKIVETPEEVYEKAYNAWASAWNKTLSGVEATEGRFVAPKYNDIKEMI